MKKVILTLIFGVLIAPINSALAVEKPITVMSRNLYLGADVGVALKKIPNMPAAAQYMWDQVQKTDFSKRKKILADQIRAESPDVLGIQEATIWYCKAHFWSKKTEVFNFTEELIAELGGTYVVASKNGIQANNPGYSIGPIPFLTKVNDPKTFQKLFGQNEADCGFQIGDALLVKRSLAQSVNQVGNSEYDAVYKVVPTLMEIYRGYAWADITVQGTNVRFVTTHLESLWDPNKIPKSSDQARQLVKDLRNSKSPIVVIGDFNSDPRDPRQLNSPNPGEQPTADTKKCPTGTTVCNAYKVMTDAGFQDSGPDATNPSSFTWGMNALLTGPDPERAKAARKMGNQYGFTDRLDYIFVKNGIKVVSTKIIGQTPPYGTDHAGVVTNLNVTATGSQLDAALDGHKRFPISFWKGIGLLLLTLVVWRIARRFRSR